MQPSPLHLTLSPIAGPQTSLSRKEITRPRREAPARRRPGGTRTRPRTFDWTWIGLNWTGLDNCRPKFTASSSTSPHILLTTNLRSRVSTIPTPLYYHPPSQLLPSRIPLPRYVAISRHVQLRPILLDARPTADKTRQDLTAVCSLQRKSKTQHCTALAPFTALHYTRTALLLHPRCVFFGRPTYRLRLDLINKPSSSSSFSTTTLDLSGLPAAAVKRPRPQHRTMVAGPFHWR